MVLVTVVVMVVVMVAMVVVMVAAVLWMVVVMVVEEVVFLHLHGLGKSNLRTVKFDKQKGWLLGFVTFTHSSLQNNLEESCEPPYHTVDRTSHTAGPSLQHVERL